MSLVDVYTKSAHILKILSQRNEPLFLDIVNFIKDDLPCQDLDLPRTPKLETASQRLLRKSLLLDWRQEMPFISQLKGYDVDFMLTELLYTIWHRDIKSHSTRTKRELDQSDEEQVPKKKSEKKWKGQDARLRDAGQEDTGQKEAKQEEAGQGQAGQQEPGEGEALEENSDLGEPCQKEAKQEEAGQGQAGQQEPGEGEALEENSDLGEPCQKEAGQGDVIRRKKRPPLRTMEWVAKREPPINDRSEDPIALLKHLLPIIQTKHAERYGELLDGVGLTKLQDQAMRSLRPNVRTLFKDKKQYHVQSLREIGGNISYKGPGHYMHVVELDPEVYYLYIGQSNNVARRIADHKLEIKRQSDEALHYRVACSEGMKGTFVLLSRCPSAIDEKTLASLLNIVETWCCLMFRTLPERTLREYLPAGALIPHPGAHLNVALPLYQASMSWKEFANAHAQLCDSPEPIVRMWYVDRKRATQAISAATVTRRSLKRIIDGGWWAVRKTTGWFSVGEITCRDVSIPIPENTMRDKGINYGDKVRVEFELLDQPHEMPFTVKALATDPAIRLGIKVTGNFDGYILPSSGGVQNVKRVNTLVDLLEDVPLAEIEGKPPLADIEGNVTAAATHESRQIDVVLASASPIYLPGSTALIHLYNKPRLERGEPAEETRELVDLVSRSAGREILNEGDFLFLFWNLLQETEQVCLYNLLPEEKKTQLANIAHRFHAYPPSLNPYSALEPNKAVQDDLAWPDHSPSNFNRFQACLPSLEYLISLLTNQHQADPPDTRDYQTIANGIVNRYYNETGRKIQNPRDVKALIYDYLTPLTRQEFLETLPETLQPRVDIYTNLYRIPIYLKSESDIFTCEGPVPSIRPSGFSPATAENTKLAVLPAEPEVQAQEGPPTPHGAPTPPFSATSPPLDQPRITNEPSATLTSANQQHISISSSETSMGPRTKPAPSGASSSPIGQAINAPKKPKPKAKKPAPPAPKSVSTKASKSMATKQKRGRDTAKTTEDKGTSDEEDQGDLVGSGPVEVSKDQPEDTGKKEVEEEEGEEDEEDTGLKNKMPVSHPEWEGTAGAPIKVTGSRLSQDTWKDWPLYNVWLDYEAGEEPPPNVRLDDWHLRNALAYFAVPKRCSSWPADFNKQGDVRLARANYGYAAKAFVPIEEEDLEAGGSYYYVVYKRYYQMMGNENENNSLKTLVGDLNIKNLAKPYLTIGSPAILQYRSGPSKKTHRNVQTLSQISTAKSIPDKKRSSAQAGLADSKKKRTYLQRREEGLGSDTEDTEPLATTEILDDATKRAVAAIDASAALINEIMAVDEELGARLSAETKAIEAVVSLGNKLLVYHRETVKMAAKKLVGIPRKLEARLKESNQPGDATRMSNEMNTWTPSKKWKGITVPGFEGTEREGTASTTR
ncbi:MAG: hypothetical protein M1830_009383 [Pleopsidium flavum]|nr:MAG: hypothetical protein M1830_009383 [Pleopsidium flavum]